jgi:hypothetical protein
MVRHQKGHKNSNGELAEWVIVSHKDGHIISSHKTKAEAEKHLGDIRKFKHMGESMQLEEAKELLESEGYIVESFKDDLIAAFVTQCGEAVIGNKPIWRKYYDRIMKNPEMAQYVKDAQADGMSADEIVEYLLDWDEHLNEDFTMGVGAPLGADQGIPHSMQGCAVPMMRLGEPAPYGKIQKCGPPHPMNRHRPIPFGLYLLGSNVNLLTYGKKRKRKKKKRKKK